MERMAVNDKEEKEVTVWDQRPMQSGPDLVYLF